MEVPAWIAAAPSFLWAATLLYGIFVFGSWALSRMGRAIVHRVEAIFGTKITFAFVDSPSLILHELSHLLVALLFGHRIQEVSLAGAWDPAKGGHVITKYNPRSFWNRLGVSMMALAPVALPLLILGGMLVAQYGTPSSIKATEWVLEVFRSKLSVSSAPLILGALYLHILISATMRLSAQDWKSFAKGSLPWTAVLTILAALFFRGGDPWAWRPVVLVGTAFATALAAKATVLTLLTFLSWVATPAARA